MDFTDKEAEQQYFCILVNAQVCIFWYKNTATLLLSLPNPNTYGQATGQGGDLLTRIIQYSNESKKLVFLQNNQTCIKSKFMTISKDFAIFFWYKYFKAPFKVLS